MATADQLAVIDALLARPFRAGDSGEAHLFSGAGYHLCHLQASRDFWEDRDEEVREGAQQEIETAFGHLAAALTARWGGPEIVRIDWDDESAPEPVSRLGMLTGEVQVWRRPEVDRWVGLAIGQADNEYPVELLVTVAELSTLPSAHRN
ncbi:hypothetical protein AAH979_41875 [Plantactinospora sp. ZYX-F-223]|uniref:hypothetical protein n=1 Tax=Plantactinospora sp. ZYX-F-223 TaxID=3144103 RepID=UPI0031FBF4F3